MNSVISNQSSASTEAMSWGDALMASPGPSTKKEAGALVLKGACMGTADIIPGVSGGTVALITGIYQDLLKAIQSFNWETIQHLLKFEIKAAVASAHLRFLIPLFFGILGAVVSTARLMHYLITEHAVYTWSLFFGLVAASIVFITRKIPQKDFKTVIAILLGTAVAYFTVGMIPVQTPDSLWFIFLCGVIAICAMILPGISGSFLLLILGKYATITGAIKNPFDLDHLLLLGVFAAGCLVGITSFSRVLSYLFSRYYNVTMGVLAGLMVGAMRKIWPWKEVLQSEIIRGKTHVLQEQNILPIVVNQEVFLAACLMLVGFVLVFILERTGERL